MRTDRLVVELTLCAVYPTRIERALSWVVLHAYMRNEGGMWGWIGDRADDLRVASQKARARWSSSRRNRRERAALVREDTDHG